MNGPNSTPIERQFTVNTINMTDAVLYAGILPHSTNERDHAYKLLDPKYTTKGAKSYIEEIARMQAVLVGASLPRELLLGASHGFESPGRKIERTQLESKTRKETQEILVDHMVDYIEDAKLTVDSLYALDMELEDIDSAEKFEIPDNLDLYPDLQRAIAVLARLYETRQYIAGGEPRKTRMNTDLLDDTNTEVQKRMAEAMYEVTVGEARKDLTEALRLEIGRLEFWLDQLLGHEGKSAQIVELGEEGSFNELSVRRRYGAVAISHVIDERINSRINTFDTYRV
jgi:hypothetical protein